MSELQVLVQRDSGLALLTLARPAERNALSFELLTDLNAALRQISADDSLSVVVLSAQGPTFCAGMNLKSVALEDPKQAERFARLLAEIYGRLLRLPIPLLCGIDGPVMGGGGGLALSADLAWSGPNARFAFPETRLGLVPALVSVVMRRRLNPTVLSGVTATAREIGPADALRLGLTDFVATESGAEEAERHARKLLRENSGEAMRRTKAFLQSQSVASLEPELDAAIKEFCAAVATESCQRGLRAFREKKSPGWSD